MFLSGIVWFFGDGLTTMLLMSSAIAAAGGAGALWYLNPSFPAVGTHTFSIQEIASGARHQANTSLMRLTGGHEEDDTFSAVPSSPAPPKDPPARAVSSWAIARQVGEVPDEAFYEV
eukprot:GHVT01004041.1.p1 GENE.GHVT01004041.1~~GHVT01004041.1.p1  ORF type:complete len:117 (-),score=16.18 GHVT01004041.1:127-477(-)